MNLQKLKLKLPRRKRCLACRELYPSYEFEPRNEEERTILLGKCCRFCRVSLGIEGGVVGGVQTGVTKDDYCVSPPFLEPEKEVVFSE